MKKWLGKFSLVTLALSSIGMFNGVHYASAQDKVELQIATWANEKEAKEFDAIIEKLNAESDEYVIKQMVIPQDYYTKVQTMIAGNQAPDLLWLAQENIPAYAKNGAIIDITENLNNQEEIDIADFFEGSLNTAKYEEKIFGLPWIGQPYVVYYNKDLFESKNVEEPTIEWTWDDFAEKAKSLTGDGVYGFANTGTVPSAVFPWGEGGDFINEKGEATVNSPESVKGLQKLYDITTNPEMTMPYDEANSLGVEQGFVNGQIGMMIGGANDDVEKKVEAAGGKFEVGMAVMPAGSKEHVTFNWTASTVISSQTRNKEVAFNALKDVTLAMFDWKVPAPIKSKAENIAEVNPYKTYALDVIKKSMEISRGFNNVPEQNELGGAQWENLDLLIITNNYNAGKLDIQATADNTQSLFENILK